MVDQPLKPKLLRALVLPNFTSTVALPVDEGGSAVTANVVALIVDDWLETLPAASKAATAYE